MNKIVELGTYRLTQGVSTADFLANNDDVNAWLRQQPGFESRELSLRDDGGWLDVVHWDSSQQAKQAADKMMVELGDCPCMTMIDSASIVMSHSRVQLNS